MIHLKIISANLPPGHKPYNPFIKIIPVHKNNTINTIIYQTKQVKKTNNPEWNKEYYIPFYCFDSVILEFWDKKIIGEKLIGKGLIQFSNDMLNRNESQNIPITLDDSSTSFRAHCTYSISSTYSSLDDQPSKFESLQVYAYLTYNPPLNPSQNEEVHLYSQKVNENGTIYEKSYEKEGKKSKMGPSGFTDVYCYNSFANNDICFYYVKSINYSGNVILNMANVPYPAEMGDINQYFLFIKDISIPVSSKKDVNISYSIFPYTFKFSNKRIECKNFQKFQNEINPQKVLLNSQNQEITNDAFLNSFNYYHSNPEGIALKTILDCGSREICPPNLPFHYRYQIELLKRYSIRSSFKFHEIQCDPTKIVICFNYNINQNFTYFVYKSGENGKDLDQMKLDQDNGIVSKYTDIGLGFIDRMSFFVSLDKIEKSVKYVSFLVTSPKPNVLNDSFCRVVDDVSKKELMFFSTNNSSGMNSVLAIMLVRKDRNDWEFLPCMQFFSGSVADNAYEFLNIFLTEKIDELFH